MALQEIISGTTPSSLVNPTAGVSEVCISGAFKGVVVLEERAPGGEWKPVNNASGAYAVTTPDGAIEYRFRPLNIEGSANVYFGP